MKLFRALLLMLAAVTAVALTASEWAVDYGCRSLICGMSIFWAREFTKGFSSPIDSNVRDPAAAPLIKTNAFEPTSVVYLFGSVAKILSYRRFTQIDDTIVRCISVDVIKPIARPFTEMNEPCDPMSLVAISINADAQVSIAHPAIYNGAHGYLSGQPDPPAENSGQ